MKQCDLCDYPTVPLLRALKNSAADHFYTASACDMQNAVDNEGYVQDDANAATVHRQETPITIALYQLYNPNATDHFYTTSLSERDNATQSGYDEEGITAYVYEAQLCGTVPLYRLYNPSVTDHFYTTSEVEKENFVRDMGYSYEGIAAYVNPKP